MLDQAPIAVFPFWSIWNPFVPTNVSFFSCEASWDKVLTLDNLKRRGRALVNMCFLSEEEEETIEHLFVHCQMPRLLWQFFLIIVGASWVFPLTVRDTLLS